MLELNSYQMLKKMLAESGELGVVAHTPWAADARQALKLIESLDLIGGFVGKEDQDYNSLMTKLFARADALIEQNMADQGFEKTDG